MTVLDDMVGMLLYVVGEMAVRQPRFFGWALAAAEALASGPVQVAVVGDVSGDLTATAWRGRPPGAVVVAVRVVVPGLAVVVVAAVGAGPVAVPMPGPAVVAGPVEVTAGPAALGALRPGDAAGAAATVGPPVTEPLA